MIAVTSLLEQSYCFYEALHRSLKPFARLGRHFEVLDTMLLGPLLRLRRWYLTRSIAFIEMVAKHYGGQVAFLGNLPDVEHRGEQFGEVKS